MSQDDLQTREIEDGVEDGSHEHPALPHPLAIRRAAASSAIAALLVIALAVGTFAVIAARRGANGAPQAAATHTPRPGHTPKPDRSPTATVATGPVLRHGAGLPEGVEVVAFTLTGPDEGWATADVVTNPVTGFPDRSMIYHFASGTWTQIGPDLPQIYLSGLDMISSSEGWVYGVNDSDTQTILHVANGSWRRASLPPLPPGVGYNILALRTPTEGWLATANMKSAYSGASSSLFSLRNGVWSQIRGAPYYITDIAAVADNEAWVIGWEHDGTSALVHVRDGVATLELTGTSHTSFYHLRMFAPNDIWIEGAMHNATNVGTGDLPLDYHYDGAAWSNVNLQAPHSAQHVDIVAPDVAWALLSKQPPPNAMGPTDGLIATMYANAGGQWSAVRLPYTDLQSLEVVSSSPTDIWALGIYWSFQQIPSDNGGQNYSGITHGVLLHYGNGAWTEYGR